MFVSISSVFAENKNVPCAPGKLCNPLNYSSVEQLLPKILDIVAQFGLIICTFFIILAGFEYVTANGDPTKITKAHNILLWSVVGTAVLLGAKVLASILANTVNQIIK
jgi:TRAP-type C4-dicarboxylate transport system permease small subunit